MKNVRLCIIDPELMTVLTYEGRVYGSMAYQLKLLHNKKFQDKYEENSPIEMLIELMPNWDEPVEEWYGLKLVEIGILKPDVLVHFWYN